MKHSPEPSGESSPPLMTRQQQRWLRMQQLARLLGLPGSGLGIAATLHFARTGQWVQAGVALLLTLGLAIATIGGKFARDLVNRIFDEIEQRLEQRVDVLAIRIVDGLEHALIRLWWRFTAHVQGRYYQTLIYTYRDFHTQGLKTRGPFALDLEKVFVPLRIVPDSLDNIPSDLIQSEQYTDGFEIWDIFTILKQQRSFRRVVILGSPGSGKSTLLEHITLTYAQGRQRRYHPQAPRFVPILVLLRDVQEAIAHDPALDLATLIHRQPIIQALQPPTDWFAAQLEQGQCLVMLDGLDEVADPTQRGQVSVWIDRQMQRYANSPFIVTSRPFGYRSAPLQQAGALVEIQPFNLEQIRQFIQNWYLQNELMRRLGRDDPGVRQMADRQAEDLSDRIRRNPPLASMATNPLLLTMIATIHCFRGALPGRRAELYAEICDVLLGRRQDAKGMHGPLTAAQKKSVLQVLALNRMRHRDPEFSAVTGGVVIQPQLAAVAGDDQYAEEFFKQIEQGSGLLVELYPGRYKFAHKSFLEYLAAVQIKEKHQELLLTRYIDDPWWEETIRLYAAQSDASDLIWAALQKQSIETLTLAYECFQEALSVSDRTVRRRLEHILERGLEATTADWFRLAAEVKLTRRLRQLLRLDEQTELDTSLLTCAEYQLFIDDPAQVEQARHPVHWAHPRFTLGTAHEPILGVRSPDAVAFCQWLTYRFSHLGDLYLQDDTPIFVGKIRFRLPTQEEAKRHPLDATAFYWCQSEAQESLSTAYEMVALSSEAWQPWRDRLLHLLQAELQQASPAPLLPYLPEKREGQVKRFWGDRPLAELSPSVLELEFTALLNGQWCTTSSWTEKQIIQELQAFDDVLVLTLDHPPEPLRLPGAIPPSDFQSLLLALVAGWHSLSEIYHNGNQHRQILQHRQLNRRESDRLARDYAQERDRLLRYYLTTWLITARQTGQLPAWEGIRIVREQV